MAKKTQHAVIGTGAAGSTVTAIHECLLDALDSTDVVGLLWKKPIPPALEWVYDFVMDNKVPFVMYYDEASTIPPKVFREADHGEVQKSRNPELAALKAISGSGKVLFLWDDKENNDDDSLINWVFANIEPGTIVLELSSALRPITLVDEGQPDEPKSRYEDADEVSPLDVLASDLQSIDEPDPVQDEVVEEPTDEDAEPRYSRDELLNMPALNVKRYGKRIKAVATTKTGIIDELFPLDTVDTTSPGVAMTEAAIEDNEAAVAVIDDPQYKSFRRNIKFLGGPPTLVNAFEDLAKVVLEGAPASRERSLAFTLMEEAHCWAVKASLLDG
jgi:hypothetical protein